MEKIRVVRNFMVELEGEVFLHKAFHSRSGLLLFIR